LLTAAPDALNKSRSMLHHARSLSAAGASNKRVALQRRFRRLRIGEARQELRGGGGVERAARGSAGGEGNLERQIWKGALGERL
jgi:hypothetical protein